MAPHPVHADGQEEELPVSAGWQIAQQRHHCPDGPASLDMQQPPARGHAAENFVPHTAPMIGPLQTHPAKDLHEVPKLDDEAAMTSIFRNA
jgi:hypothetical protein